MIEIIRTARSIIPASYLRKTGISVPPYVFILNDENIHGVSFPNFFQINYGFIKRARSSDFFKLLVRAVTFLVPIFQSIFSCECAATLSGPSNRFYFFFLEIFHIFLKFELIFCRFWRIDEQELLEGINRTNVAYGGWNYDVTNVFFVYGSLDPWLALGITHADKNKPYYVRIIPGTYP